ncbi:hypothetical protein K1719_007918 [Acacia pycnantha]|nr:hypothetical protein K1719_007918 [Acacia pycnantha]
MGASRKQQGEIDRVLKKVQERVEVFDSILKKVYDADNANQKEKFEAELKKEIKKLQRHRDQIKTWIQSSEIKDRKVSASYEQALVDARKLIEREMERFKICEKEAKTKAFSKEGLGQQPKTDPKEKAKSETRDWLNNVVGELESQIDVFEAEVERLSAKKGKNWPPRLTHLETSITRHKSHIKKCELLLRLLDNDELSAEQVNDVKDFLEDYVERNQDSFDEFNDVDDLYSSLPLDKVESLEDLVTIGSPGTAKGTAAPSLKNSAVASASASQTSEQDDDTASQDSNSDIGARTPPSKTIRSNSTSSTPDRNHTTPVSRNILAHNFSGVPPITSILPGSNSVQGTLENSTASNSSSSVNQSSSVKEEEINRPSPPLYDAALTRGIGRNSLANQATSSIPLGSCNIVSSSGALGSVPSASEITKRNILGADDRLGGGGMVQPLVTPLSNRTILPQVAKSNDGTASFDSVNVDEAAAVSGRDFSSSVVPGVQLRPGSPFQNQNEMGKLQGRTEIAPDKSEKFLQKFQQVQQQGHSNLFGMPSLGGGNQKQFSAQQQNPLLQQFGSLGSSITSQSGLSLGTQAQGFISIPSTSLQLAPNSINYPSNQQQLISGFSRDADVGNSMVEDHQQLQQNFPEEGATESTDSAGLGKNIINEDDLRSTYVADSPVGLCGSLPTDPAQTSRDTDLSPIKPLQSNQPAGNLGVIGIDVDFGAIDDDFSESSVNSGGMHDKLYNLQMLEAAYYKLPHPKDSERPRAYVPRHPTMTPASYPQVQAPIVNNPAFWEGVGHQPFGTDTLFFAFYYQQNTYQQYLAAKELKKLSWRYHRRYNTWFQRHVEPKVVTDEYEQGTYVYFDFHIANDELQHGWCQRIKTEFTFEYDYLEDELVI